MFHRIFHRIAARPPRVAGLAVIAAAAAALAVPSLASAFADPAGPVNCGFHGFNTITAYPSNDVTSWFGGRETVYFSPNLQRWNGSAWVDYDTSEPWLHATTSSARVLPMNLGGVYYWENARGHIQEYFTFTPLHVGAYRVVDFYYWPSSDRQLSVVASTYYNGNENNCRIV